MPDKIIKPERWAPLLFWGIGLFVSIILLWTTRNVYIENRVLQYENIAVVILIFISLLVIEAWFRKYLIILSNDFLRINKLWYGFKSIPKENICSGGLELTASSLSGKGYIKIIYYEDDNLKEEKINLSLLSDADILVLIEWFGDKSDGFIPNRYLKN